MITVNYGGEDAKYWYLAGEDRYTDEFGGSDLTDAERIATAAFLGPDETYDDVLGLARSLMTSFITEEFGTTVDELYGLEYE
jgi:hypothetical protein